MKNKLGTQNWQGFVAAFGGLVAILSYLVVFEELYFAVIGGAIAIIFGFWSSYANVGKRIT